MLSKGLDDFETRASKGFVDILSARDYKNSWINGCSKTQDKRKFMVY